VQVLVFNLGNMIAYTATSPTFTDNFHLLNQNAEPIKKPSYVTPEMSETVWKHTEKLVDQALQSPA
jgi:hypothetical protein